MTDVTPFFRLKSHTSNGLVDYLFFNYDVSSRPGRGTAARSRLVVWLVFDFFDSRRVHRTVVKRGARKCKKSMRQLLIFIKLNRRENVKRKKKRDLFGATDDNGIFGRGGIG